MLRQQWQRKGIENFRSLADYIAPVISGREDFIGAFAVTTGHGCDELAKKYRDELDDYNAIMVSALADRLAEAFAEMLHQQARKDWGFGVDENLDQEQLIKEKYRGIRPAAGYPACPDHTEKATLWELLNAEAQTGISLTESFAMWPGAAVSGLYFAHPEARYFAINKITKDQCEHYAKLKGLSIAECERWLSPLLVLKRLTWARLEIIDATNQQLVPKRLRPLVCSLFHLATCLKSRCEGWQLANGTHFTSRRAV